MESLDARLDFIAFANGVRIDPTTPGGDADLMAFLIGDLCDFRDRPAEEALTNRRRAVLQHHDPEHYAELAARHSWPEI